MKKRYKSKILIWMIGTMLILSAACLFMNAGEGVFSYASSSTGVVTATLLNVRTGPSTSYTLKTQLAKGTAVTIVEEAADGWYKITYPSGSSTATGYVSAAYIALDTTVRSGVVNATSLNVRSGPSTTYEIQTKLAKGTSVDIIADAGNGWYKIDYTYNNSSYTGYVSGEYITISDKDEDGTTAAPVTASAFEKALYEQGFPESYVSSLMKLHEQYPEWKFVAVNTGLDWEKVIAGETNKTGSIKNLVQCTTSSPHYNWRSTDVGYNWATDTFSVYDGTNWYAADKDLIAYYLDPRNCLDEYYIFEFESLNYISGGQTVSGVEAVLSGTFMAGKVPTGSSTKYSSIMMKAATQSGVSPYHIATRIKNEVGSSGSSATTGKNSTYPGIYNFYNIGAYDSAAGNAVTTGLKWAASGSSYGRPWTTPEKSIIGGASYIGSSYISVGQNTLYTQKFNVTNKSAGYYAHQYQTNVQAPTVEGYKTGNAYKSQGMKSGTITFNIPVYKNMPSSRCTKPADSGSQNNWLKTLKVTGYSLTPSFAVNTVNDYSLIVDHDVASIAISAGTVNSKATVSGTGNKNLAVGTNSFSVKVTAQNGDVRKYTVTVVRKAAEGQKPEAPSESTEELKFGSTYTVSDGYIMGVATGTSASTVVSKLTATKGATVKVYSSNGTTANTGVVGTGNIVKVTYNGVTTSYTICIYGDVSGDGAITALDLLKVQKHLLNASRLSGVYAKAANVKRSGSSITALDLLKIQKHIVGSSKITQ